MTTNDVCAVCQREQCCCKGIQTYSMSKYPGENKLVKIFPENEPIENQWYRRLDADRKLATLTASLAEVTRELSGIDDVLERRPIFDDCKTRRDKIEKAISTAKRVDEVTRENNNLQGQLAVKDVGLHSKLVTELKAQITTLEAENKGLREAAQSLVNKLNVIHANPLFQSVWFSAANHGIDYSKGPTYIHELAALTESLTTPTPTDGEKA